MGDFVNLLCDIGNTNFCFFEDGRMFRRSIHAFSPETETRPVFYINVNRDVASKLEPLPNWIDLEPAIRTLGYYATMGIDRIVACEAIDEGVILDAGSAITVDAVRGGRFQGGFIYPGLPALTSTYAAISPGIAYPLNVEVSPHTLPKNSRDAVSYGALIPLIREIDRLGRPLYLTGGDAPKLSHYFPDAVMDETLLFQGMRKIIKESAMTA